MNPVRSPRARLLQRPHWARRLGRSVRMLVLRARIRQLYATLHRQDELDCIDPVMWRMLEARLAELRCELHMLEMQP